MGKGIEQAVTTITGLIYSDISIRGLVGQADKAFSGTDIHPGDMTEIALELRIGEGFTRNGVVIIVLPNIVLRTMKTVLPYTVRAGTQPTFAYYLVFGIVETDSHQIDYAGEVIGIIEGDDAVGGDGPLGFIQIAEAVVGGDNKVGSLLFYI